MQETARINYQSPEINGWLPRCFTNRNDTSKVAPPQFSREYKLLNLCATYGEIFKRSWVRMRVANKDWCASRKVVSMSIRPLFFLTALAKPSGPSAINTSRNPFGGCETAIQRSIKISKSLELLPYCMQTHLLNPRYNNVQCKGFQKQNERVSTFTFTRQF